MEKDEPTLAKDLSVTTTPTTQKEKGDSSGKRSKSTHACDLCKKKKVKCNGEYPCARCQKSGLYCTFNQHKQKRSTSKLYVNTQEQRIHALEKALNSLYVEPTVQPFDNCHAILINDITNQAVMTPIEKFNISSTGRPYYARDWTARLDRLPSTFGKMTMLENEPRKPDAFALPDTSINHHLLSTYFDHVHPYFPMIHKESFFLGIQEQSPLLLNAMYAVADQWVHIDLMVSGAGLPDSRSSESPLMAPRPPPGLKYYQDAISLIELYTDAPRLSTIQALLLIVKYHELVRRPGFFYRTRFYFDLVVRMCKDLGLPRLLPPTCQVHPILAEQRRRVFWIAYVYDLLMSTELGTPPMFSLDECTVELPSLLEDERRFREQHDTILYFHWMTMVMKAQGSVMRYLRKKYNDQPNKRQQNDSNHLYTLHQHMEGLGRELQLWKKPARGRVNFLFLAYHFTNILLYRSMALDIINGNNHQTQLMGMEQDYVKSFLSNEANAIADIVDMLLKEHTVACLHYSFRGIQQIIHYLTAAWTVQLMYRQTSNNNNNSRVKTMIQQLTLLTPVVELCTKQQQQSSQHIAPHQHNSADVQQQNPKDYSISATTTPRKRESLRKDRNQKQLVKSQSTASPSSSSSPSTSISSPSSSPSPSHSHPYIYPHIGAPQQATPMNGPESDTTQHMNNTLIINTAPPNTLWQQQQPHTQPQNWTGQNIENQFVSPAQLSSSPTPMSTSELVSTIHTHAGDPHPLPLLNTSTLALLYQPSSSSSSLSSSEPMIPTPSLGSLSSTSSLSTIASTPVDASLSHGSHGPLRLRRSHQQLRNTSYRLPSSDPRSSGSTPLHHPYMSAANPTNTSSLLQQQQHTSPRRHTVSSGPSSPSTSSLPSSPLHRMTLADDPWIQAPPPQQQSPAVIHSHSTATPPLPLPPSSNSPSSSPSNLLLCDDQNAFSDLPPSSIHQYGVEQHEHDDMENAIYNMPLMDDPLLIKPAAEEESMVGLLMPTRLDWDHQVTSTSNTTVSRGSSSPLPPT